MTRLLSAWKSGNHTAVGVRKQMFGLERRNLKAYYIQKDSPINSMKKKFLNCCYLIVKHTALYRYNISSSELQQKLSDQVYRRQDSYNWNKDDHEVLLIWKKKWEGQQIGWYLIRILKDTLMTDIINFSYIPTLCQILSRKLVKKISHCSPK